MYLRRPLRILTSILFSLTLIGSVKPAFGQSSTTSERNLLSLQVTAGAGVASHGPGFTAGVTISPGSEKWAFGVESQSSIALFFLADDYRRWIGPIGFRTWQKEKYAFAAGFGIGEVSGSKERTDEAYEGCDFFNCESTRMAPYPAVMLEVRAITHSQWLGLGIRPFVWLGNEVVGGVTLNLHFGGF